MNQIKKIRNITKGTLIADRVSIANTPLTRMRGLLGKDNLKQGEGLLIEPCSSIHTFFMKFSIDVLFLSKQNRVVALVKELVPGRLFSKTRGARKCIELIVRSIDASKTEIGDKILIE